MRANDREGWREGHPGGPGAGRFLPPEAPPGPGVRPATCDQTTCPPLPCWPRLGTRPRPPRTPRRTPTRRRRRRRLGAWTRRPRRRPPPSTTCPRAEPHAPRHTTRHKAPSSGASLRLQGTRGHVSRGAGGGGPPSFPGKVPPRPAPRSATYSGGSFRRVANARCVGSALSLLPAGCGGRLSRFLTQRKR